MDGFQLRDEEVQVRVRLAEEFLDPSEHMNWLQEANHSNITLRR